MVDGKDLNKMEGTQEETEFIQQQGKNETLKSHKISIRANPKIQELLDKAHRWREDPNQLWVASSEIDQSEKSGRNPNYEGEGE